MGKVLLFSHHNTLAAWSLLDYGSCITWRLVSNLGEWRAGSGLCHFTSSASSKTEGWVCSGVGDAHMDCRRAGKAV
jgi:hypothetical protein